MNTNIIRILIYELTNNKNNNDNHTNDNYYYYLKKKSGLIQFFFFSVFKPKKYCFFILFNCVIHKK